MPLKFSSIGEAADWLCQQFAPELKVAAPLGLGKPNQLLNLLYQRACSDPKLQLTFFTALSLNPPKASGLAGRFLNPFSRRHFGADYPDLLYAKEKLPPNLHVHEFYFQAGAYLHTPQMQRDYINLNYTHVASAVHAMGVQVVLQLIAQRVVNGEVRYSLSCNPDLTLDLCDKGNVVVLGVVHPDLPFMGGDAEVSEDFFAAIVDSDEVRHQLFALPRLPIDPADQWIGFHAARWVRDGGTLQIGIGSLSDAVVAALVLRQKNNSLYRRVTGDAVAPFEHGLYGLSEMVTDGFMLLRRAGILHREVIDEASGARTFLHGAFFLGSKDFYAWLRDLPADEARGVRMTRVSKVNDLYDPNELLLRRQRKHPRFLNTCMQVTLLGGAASDTLPDGRVVSGVGGQFNFVAMAHELPDSRSLLLLRSTREKNGKRESNIVLGHPHLTIPRHLRDIVVTEYGAADLLGRTDEQCIQAMLAIADSDFQEALAHAAKASGKLSPDYVIPESARNNTPARIASETAKLGEAFEPFPFGSDFTPVEERLALALGKLQNQSQLGQLATALRGLFRDRAPHQAELERLGLWPAKSIGDRLNAAAVSEALAGSPTR